MNVLQPNYDCIPAELKTCNQWVCWLLKKTEQLNGKAPKKPFTKVPICPLTGNYASTTDPTTWTDFATAWSYYEAFVESDGIHGLGYILRDDLIGVDLDGCRDLDSGTIAEWATGIISLLDSYTEISPSGTGIRIFCKGQPRPKGSNRRKGDIEIYDCNSPRYLTVTGWHLDGTPLAIEPRQIELGRLYGQVFAQAEKKPPAPLRPIFSTAATDEILAVAMSAQNGEKFAKLWKGDWEGDYPSQSEADLALASLLAFYTGPDEKVLDELFRQSGLYRDKWERGDYRERVLAKALDQEEFYSWGVSPQCEAEIMAMVAESCVDTKSRPQPQKKEKPSQTQRLIKIAEAGELWRTPDCTAFTTVRVGDHMENMPIASTAYRRWLVNRYYEQYGNTVGEKARTAALEIIESKALAGTVHHAHLRIARLLDRIYIDLGNDKWDAVEITANGWRVVANPPVKFRRTKNTGDLPYPAKGGSLEQLRPFVNPTEDGWVLIQGWLLDCIKGQGPYHILIATGEQGSAKSSLFRFCRSVIDPVKLAPLASLPREERDLGIDGQAEYMLCYDNVSFLPPWLSDAFCRAATGGGIKTRKLYTDDEQTIFDICRPIGLNGIPDFAENSDLLSRCLILSQPTIPEDRRLDEHDLNGRFALVRPVIFGALCDLAVNGLRNLPSIQLPRLPRMADSAKWITACLGNDAFLRQQQINEAKAVDLGLESSQTAQILRELLNAKGNHWKGTCGDLLQALKSKSVELGIYGKLPESPRGLGSRLRRDAPAIRKGWGVDVKFIMSDGRSTVIIQPIQAGQK